MDLHQCAVWSRCYNLRTPRRLFKILGCSPLHSHPGRCLALSLSSGESLIPHHSFRHPACYLSSLARNHSITMATDNRGPELVVVLGLFLAFSWVFTALRVYVRLMISKNWGSDDTILLAALVCEPPQFQLKILIVYGRSASPSTAHVPS
jgi:hypothetical protein